MAGYGRFCLTRLRNSDRVRASARKRPSMHDVTAYEDCFSTPRMRMHR